MFPPRLFLVYCIQIILSAVLARLVLRFWKAGEVSGRTAGIALGGLIVLQALFFTFYYLALHNNFLNGAVDMATISQSLWNMAEGNRPFETILGTHSMRVHFSPVWYAVSILFRIWPSIPWLVWLSTLSVAGAAWIIYKTTYTLTQSRWLAFALGFSYLFNPYLQMAQIAAAHAESFDICIILFSLYALIRRRWTWFWPCFVLALLGKEDVGLYYGAIGVYAFFGLKARWPGIVMAGVGVVWSLAVFKVIMPLFGPDTQNLISRFSALGTGGYGDIAKNLLIHPWLVLTPLLHWEKLFSLFYMLAQTALLSLWGGWAVVPLGFALWFKSVTNYVGMYNFWDHYSLHILPFVYFASALGLKRWLENPKYRVWLERVAGKETALPVFLACFIIILSLFINLERGQNPLSRKFTWSTFHVTDHSRIGRDLLKKIPANASVLAQEHIAPHVSFRKELYAVSAQYAWKRDEKPLVKPDYAVFDLLGAKHLSFRRQIEQTADYFYRNPAYRVVEEEDGWVLFQRQSSEP